VSEEQTVETDTLSDETARAKRAAAEAGRQLAAIRASSPGAHRLGRELEAENDKNGFYLLVRNALRSG
jgi:hypothetical protein